MSKFQPDKLSTIKEPYPESSLTLGETNDNLWSHASLMINQESTTSVNSIDYYNKGIALNTPGKYDNMMEESDITTALNPSDTIPKEITQVTLENHAKKSKASVIASPNEIQSVVYPSTTFSLTDVTGTVSYIETYLDKSLSKLEYLNLVVGYFKKVSQEIGDDTISNKVIDKVIDDYAYKSIGLADAVKIISQRYYEMPISSIEVFLSTSIDTTKAAIAIESHVFHIEEVRAKVSQHYLHSNIALKIIETRTNTNNTESTTSVFESIFKDLMPDVMIENFKQFSFAHVDLMDNAPMDSLEEAARQTSKLAVELARSKCDLTEESQRFFEEAVKALIHQGLEEYLFVYHADQHINYHELNPNFQEFINQANYNMEPSIRAVGEVMNSVYESENS